MNTQPPDEAAAWTLAALLGWLLLEKSLKEYKLTTEQVRGTHEVRAQYGLPPEKLDIKQIHAELQVAIEQGDLGAIQRSGNDLLAWIIWSEEVQSNTTVYRANPFSGETVALCLRAGDMYDRIIGLTIEFENDPPLLWTQGFESGTTSGWSFVDAGPKST